MPIPLGQSELSFSVAVREAFAFLEHDYDFSVESEGSSQVTFGSDKVSVVVFHGRTSKELGIEVGLKSAEYGFGLAVLQAIYPEHAQIESKPVFTTLEEIRSALVHQAVELRRVGGRALVGDPQEYDRLKLHMRTYWDKRNLVGAMEQAKAAFAAKDFRGVCHLLEPYEKYLSPAELKMLQVSKTRASAQGDGAA